MSRDLSNPVPHLKAALDDPGLHLAYHASTLAIEERPAGASIEKVYFFAPPK